MDGKPIGRDRRWTLQLMTLAASLALAVLFVAENFVIVEIRLVTWELQARLAWAMLVSGGLGIVAGLLLPRLWR